MPQQFLTLEYNGAEKTMEDWGFSDPSLIVNSQGSGRFTVRGTVKRAATVVPVVPYDGWIIVRDNRTKNPASGALENGLIIFQGSRTTLPKKVNPRSDTLNYTFLDPWHDLEQIYFQQNRKVWLGGDPTNLGDDFTTEIVLFQALDPVLITKPQNIGQQITEILTYAIAQGARLQIGTVEPTAKVSTYQIRDTYCATAINLSLRAAPDVTARFDYTTTPPTIHFRKRASRPPVTLPWMDGETHQTSELTGREDLVVPCVSLKFKRTDTQNGRTMVEPMNAPPNWQLYPLSATGRERGALVATIDLQGAQSTNVFGSLVTQPFTAGGTNAQRQAFWKSQHPQFKSPKTVINSIDFPTVTDEFDAAVDLAQYPNELTGGTVASWMTIGLNPPRFIKYKNATVQAVISYDELDDNNLPTKKSKKHTFSASITLTDGLTGDYSALASAVEGEAIPDGMAQSIFESLALKEFEGSHTIVEQRASYSIGMGNTLNLAGGDPDWATMKASIRSIRYDFQEAFTSTTIEIGPAPHLSAGDLVQLFLINQRREIFFNPATVGTAEGGSGGSVTLGKQVPRENTNAGLDQVSFYSISEPVPNKPEQKNLHFDATNHELQLSVINTITGLPDFAQGGFSLKVAECLGSDGLMHKVYTQELFVYDANCVQKKQLFICSDPF